MTGLTYPYARHDRLLASHDDLDLEFSPAPNPPAGTAGGAARYKYWVDTNTSTLRQCIASRATAGVYVPGEWITLGVVDLSTGKFHFNTDGVDFTGGSGALAVHDLTVSGTSSLNTLNVGGAASLNTVSVGGTLSVSGTTALHSVGVTGNLDVTGNTNTVSLGVSGASSLHSTTITGDMVVTGTTTSSVLHVTGDTNLNTLEVAGATTLTNTTVNGDLVTHGTITTDHIVITISGGDQTLTSLHVTGDVGIDGSLTVIGTATVGALHSWNDVTGSSINSSGPVTGTAITGTAVSSSGLMTAGADLQVDGNLHVAHDTDIGGNLNVANNLTVGGAFTVSGAFAPGGDVVAHSKFISNFDGTNHQVLSVVTDSVNILTWLTGPGWTGPTGCQIRLYEPGLGILYQASGHAFHAEGTVGTSIDTLGPSIAIFLATGETANSSGTWGIISDDTVKENVAPYTAGLADLLELNPVSFNYYVPTGRGDKRWSPFAEPRGTPPKTHYGLLASNVRQVLPEMAALLNFGTPGPDGLPSMLWTISPTHLVYVLTNAVKELSEQDTNLDTRLTAVEGHAPPTITLVGDITGSGTPTINATLSVVNSNPGTFQGLIVNAKGQVTGASNMSYAPLASPALTGSPTAPTPTNNTATTRIATTAFVRLGTATNDDAPAGQIGEYLFAQVLSTASVPLTNNVDAALIALALTAGDWEVWGSVGYTIAGNNNTTLKAWINQTGAATAPSVDQVGGYSVMPVVNAITQMILPVTPARVSLAAPGNVRLGATGLFAGTISAWGKIMARRVR